MNKKKFEYVLHEFKLGKLHRGYDGLVTDYKQALAIAFQSARRKK